VSFAAKPFTFAPERRTGLFVSSEIRDATGFLRNGARCALQCPDRCNVLRSSENSLQSRLFVHFGLRENPFAGTPDPRFLFHSETHREALASLINGIDCEFGFQALVAQPGMGKTTLLFDFLEGFRANAYTAFLFQPQLEPHELLQSLLSELGAGSEDKSVWKLSEQINQLLGRAAQERKRVIVVVDEAQNLDFAVLETLRQLSNFETAQAKLMQIVLAGQPQLAKKLAAPEQEQLRQRIASIGRLSPLNLNETRAYINHRLRTAGYRGPDLFTLNAVKNIWETGKGVPRNINTLCFNAMLLGFAGNTKSIDEAILAEAARDLDMPSVFADMYRMDPSAAESAAHSRNGHDADTLQSGRGRNFVPDQPVKAEGSDVSQQSRLPQAETAAVLTPSGNGSTNGSGENIPRELIEAIVRTSQTLEQQKALLAAIPAPSAEAQPASESDNAAALGTIVTAPAKTPVKAEAVTKSATSAPAKTDSTTSGITSGNGKTRKRETSLVQNASKNGSTPRPEMVPPTQVAVPESITRSYHPKLSKPAESGRLWSKALALVAITGVLTFVVIEKSPWQNMARANGTEQSQSAADTSDASSGFVVPKGSPASPMDAPVRGASDVRAHSSGQDRFDDVTVRKFPEDRSATAIDGKDMQDGRTVYFEQDSDDIAGQYRSTLQQIAAGLEKNPEASAILEGHTDDSGPEAYNLDLSSRRAIAVRNALVNEFKVSSTRLTAIGSGSASPVQPNSSAAGRASNRRVSVRLVHLGE